jgi:putative SOS response-associated peptidase YedK
MCGKFTAMASWSQVHAYSGAFTSIDNANDYEVTFRVMGNLRVIVWDEETKARKVVPMRWGFPHPKNWKVPQPIHARSEPMDELKTFKASFLGGKRGIVLVRTFNEGKQVSKSKCEQWTIDPIPACKTGAAFIFDIFTTPDLPAPFLACALVTVPANELIRSLSTEFAEADRMPAFLDPADWATWLGEGGNDPAAAQTACRTVEGIRWKMTKEERQATQKRQKPTVSDPSGLL